MFKLRPILQVMALLAAALAQSTAYAAYSDKVFTLTNSGNGVLTVSGAVIADNLSEYSVTQNTCTAVAPGGSCSITVRFSPTGADARPAGRLVLSSNGSNPTHSVSLSGTGAPNEIHHAIAASASDVNMASLFGNPVAPATYVLTINAGVYVTATSTATNALTTGAFPSGSTVKIINNGYIIGKGGQAGAGSSTYGGAGSPGGGAISLSQSAHIDNTVGYIYGGGGGGGGGGSASNGGKNYDCGAGSGGGGGGAGSGAGAAGGRPAMPLTSTGGTGAAGGLIAGGAGGAGAGSPCGGMGGGAGGAGGAPGAAGATGGTGWGGGSNYTGGVGGSGGPAVRLNGNSVTWTNFDTTHVSGAVQ